MWKHWLENPYSVPGGKVSEELSSVETFRQYQKHNHFQKVSEELSSVETIRVVYRFHTTLNLFQKNLVVWKPGRTFSQSGLTRRVSEELSSVETRLQRYRILHFHHSFRRT